MIYNLCKSKNINNIYVIILFILIFTGCGNWSSTNLEINNNSDYSLLDVVFYSENWELNTTSFGTINNKETSAREIADEYWSSFDFTGYINFKLKASDGKILYCKTSKDIRINKRKNEYKLNNNTIVEYSSGYATIREIAGK